MADYSFDTHLSGAVASNVAADVTLGGLNDINVDSTVKSDSKVNTDSKVVATSDSKVNTDSKVVATSDSKVATDSRVATTSAVDLAPVAVDSCVRVELGPLPPTQVSTPWEQRFGLSILGLELIAWTVSGRTATTVVPFSPPPRVVGLLEQDHRDHGDDERHGLHIRLG